MAEKNLGTTYASLVKALKARQFSPVYLLMGEEPYYIDKISDYIANHVMAPEMRDFNQSVVFGADVTAVQVADLCREYPMMSEYRVVVVKEAQNLKGWELLFKGSKTGSYLTIEHPSRRVVSHDGRLHQQSGT